MYFKYPITVTNGDITLHTDVDTAISDAITSSLLTQTGERVLRPDYGLPDLYFQSITPNVTSTMQSTIQAGLEGFDVAYALETEVNDDGSIKAIVTYDNRTVETIL